MSGRSITIYTIADLIGSRLTLTAHCYNLDCRHSQELDAQALAHRLGPDHPILHKYLAPKLHCSRCGGRNIGLRVGARIPGQTSIPGNADER